MSHSMISPLRSAENHKFLFHRNVMIDLRRMMHYWMKELNVPLSLVLLGVNIVTIGVIVALVVNAGIHIKC